MVWIVQDSILNTVEGKKLVKAVIDSRVKVVSLFADEAQIALHSMKSVCAAVFRRLAAASGFVCFVSGTLFPLGASGDGKGLLLCLSGPWDEGSENSFKWKPAQ